MSTFKKRLRYYLIGFSLGAVMIFFVFGNRACSWLPENRVKNMIAEKQIIVGDSLWDLMSCQGINSDDIYRFLNADGDVDFGDSQPREYPKIYLFRGDKDNEDLSISFALYEEYSEVVSFDYNQKNCSTDKSNKGKIIVPIPDSEVRAIIESMEMRIMDEVRCQMKCHSIREKDLIVFHQTASVYMPETDPHTEENGYYTMKGKIGKRIYRIKYVKGERRIRISNIAGEKKCGCDL